MPLRLSPDTSGVAPRRSRRLPPTWSAQVVGEFRMELPAYAKEIVDEWEAQVKR